MEEAMSQGADLDGKVAWVTGASRGLGREVALALAAAGAEVALSARDGESLEELRETIAADGGVAHAFPGSVAEAADVERTAAAIAAATGRIDVLVNNAGISPSFERSERLASADWQAVIDVNLTGAFACSQAAVALMGAGGAIVNVSSIHATAGMERVAAYAASKGGLEALTRSLAVEWAERGIRVNAIAPGYIETEMSSGLREHDYWSARLLERIPLGRFGRSEEIVPAILFLAGSGASYLTGATLFVDGGWTAR
jgi:NAD(P)-dependent dehydrogenase (short-subunit alcohol dehydrogenase family)